MALLQDLLEPHSCHKEWAASDILIDIGQLPPPKITQPPRQDVNSDEVRIYSFFVVVVVFQIIHSFLLIFSVLLKAQTFYYYCVCLCVYDVCVCVGGAVCWKVRGLQEFSLSAPGSMVSLVSAVMHTPVSWTFYLFCYAYCGSTSGYSGRS